MNDKHKILSATAIYHAFNDGAVAAIPLLFPIFKDIFGLSYTQVGVITGGGLLITLVAQLMIGRISDHKDFRTLLSTGIFLLCISLLLLTQTQGFLSLLLFIFVLRFASSFYHPIGIGWISRTFKKDRLDSYRFTPFRSYLFKILDNHAKDYFKEKKRRMGNK